MKHGHLRVQRSGVMLPLFFWSLAGLACWYILGSGLLSPVGHRMPWDPQTLSPNCWFALLAEMLSVARQSGWLTVATLFLALRMVLSPAVEAWLYHRLAGGHGQPAWKGFYGLHLVLLLGTGLVGWILLVHVDSLINLLYQPLLTLGWGMVLAIVLFIGGLLITWYKLRLSDRAHLIWPRISRWLELALAQGLLTMFFGLLISVIQYFALSAAGVALIGLLILVNLVRVYGRLWKMACAIHALQGR